jgi:hypothetical protein
MLLSHSALAAKTFMRSEIAATVPLWVIQMFVSRTLAFPSHHPISSLLCSSVYDSQHNMGFQYAGLLLALIACVIAPIPFLFFFKGEAVRKRSKRAFVN